MLTNGEIYTAYITAANQTLRPQDERIALAFAREVEAAVLAKAIPPGYVVVPSDPTDEMLDAAHEGDRQYTMRNFGDVMTVMQGPYDHYVAMLEAAPTGGTP
jgi:hypothetical protein